MTPMARGAVSVVAVQCPLLAAVVMVMAVVAAVAAVVAVVVQAVAVATTTIAGETAIGLVTLTSWGA